MGPRANTTPPRTALAEAAEMGYNGGVPAALLLLALWTAVPARSEDGVSETRAGDVKIQTSLSPGEIAANFFLLPLAYAFSQPHYGFERFPYEEGDGYGRGTRDWSAGLKLGGQALPGGRAGGHAELAVRGANRLGWRAAWDGFATGTLRGGPRGDFWSGHITANYAQTGAALFEVGLGAAAFNSQGSRAGPSAALVFEAFPRKPLTVSLRYEGAMLRRQGYHDLALRAGATVLGAGLYAGLHAFLGPAGSASGPELGLALWF